MRPRGKCASKCRHHLEHRAYLSFSRQRNRFLLPRHRYPTKRRTMNPEFCCCCARSLSHIPPLYTDEKSEKPQSVPSDHTLPCCGRTICGNCIHGNERFATYCPFCQI